MHTAHTHNRTRRQGFTLLEVLIVMVLFTVVTGIVYATFSTVVNSAEDVRVDIERVRLEEYLIRSLTTNLATVFTDPMYEDANFHFVGKDFEDEDGPGDSLTFCSTAPLLGGFSLPGDVKLVTYEIPGLYDEDLFLSEDRDRAIREYEERLGVDALDNPYELGRKLSISETPMMTGNTRSMRGQLEEDEDIFAANEQLRARSRGREAFGGGQENTANDIDAQRRRQEAERRREERRRPRPSDYMDDEYYDEQRPVNEALFQTPYFEMPIRTLDIEYFDGEEWVQEWNSSAYDNSAELEQTTGFSLNRPKVGEPMGRLPWAVRFRINFAKTQEELERDRQEGYNEDEDVDFEMVVPVRQGQGITQHVYEVPELQNLIPGYIGPGRQPNPDEEGEEGERGGQGGNRNNTNSNTRFGTRS